MPCCCAAGPQEGVALGSIIDPKRQTGPSGQLNVERFGTEREIEAARRQSAAAEFEAKQRGEKSQLQHLTHTRLSSL